jgi:hypothetical protein
MPASAAQTLKSLNNENEQVLGIHRDRVVAGLILGWLLSLMSGSIFVVIGVGCVGAIVGVVLGIIHRNDTNAKWF